MAIMPKTIFQKLDSANEREAIELIANGLPTVVALLREYTTKFHEDPLPGSPVAEALAHDDYRLPFDFASFLLMATDDHLDALATLFMPRAEGERLVRILHRYAHAPLLRAAAEGSAHAAWLLDPGLDRDRRLQRALAVWLYSAQQQLSLDDNHPTAAARIVKLREKAATYGFPEHPSPKPSQTIVPAKKLQHFGDPRPETTTKHFGTLLPNGEFVYRYLSATTHSTLYGVIENARAAGEASPGVSSTVTTANVRTLLLTVKNVLRVVDVAMGWWSQLAGYDPSTWLRARRNAGPL